MGVGKYAAHFLFTFSATLFGWIMLNVQMSYDATLIPPLPYLTYFPASYIEVNRNTYLVSNTSNPAFPATCHGVMGCTLQLCPSLGPNGVFCGVMPSQCHAASMTALYSLYPWAERAWIISVVSLVLNLPLIVVWVAQVVTRSKGYVIMTEHRRKVLGVWYLFYVSSKVLMGLAIIAYLYFKFSYYTVSQDQPPFELGAWLGTLLAYYIFFLTVEGVISGYSLHHLFKVPEHYWGLDNRL